MASPITKNGGGGSGRSIKGNTGPIRTIFTGYKTVATTLFQPVRASVRKKAAPLSGMSRTTDRITMLYKKRKINPDARKIATNFFLVVFMSLY